MQGTADILVAYATRHGSTIDVAQHVADRLRDAGLSADFQRMSDVRAIDGYRAVVLGAPLYTGRWHRDARRFLRRHRGELATRMVAVFALGPRTLDAKDVRDSRAQLDRSLAKVPEVHPSLLEVFGGVIDPAELRFPFSRLPASDARDWHAIDGFADRIVQEVSAACAS